MAVTKAAGGKLESLNVLAGAATQVAVVGAIDGRRRRRRQRSWVRRGGGPVAMA